jgi:hypothetical protein
MPERFLTSPFEPDRHERLLNVATRTLSNA